MALVNPTEGNPSIKYPSSKFNFLISLILILGINEYFMY